MPDVQSWNDDLGEGEDNDASSIGDDNGEDDGFGGGGSADYEKDGNLRCGYHLVAFELAEISPTPPIEPPMPAPIPDQPFSSSSVATDPHFSSPPLSPAVADQLATPPTTPEKGVSKKRESLRIEANTTPTRVGKLLYKASLTVTTPSKQLASATLAHVYAKSGSDREALLLLAKDYIAFVAGETQMKNVDEKTAVMNLKRFVHVASYLPLKPSPDIGLQGLNKSEVLTLLFVRDPSYNLKVMS